MIDSQRRFGCLMYHNIADEPHNPYSIPKETFRKQLNSLVAEGYILEGFSGLKARLSSDIWPERYCVISFDDGHRTFLDAAEILAAIGIRASFFLTRDFCRKRSDFLKDGEIRQLASMGELGTHGVTHSALTTLSPQAAQEELVTSKTWLEQCTGNPVTDMSAPGGFWNIRLQQMALRAGYDMVGTSREWWNKPSAIGKSRTVCRTAVRAQFPAGLFASISKCDSVFYLRRDLRSKLLYWPKQILIRARAS